LALRIAAAGVHVVLARFRDALAAAGRAVAVEVAAAAHVAVVDEEDAARGAGEEQGGSDVERAAKHPVMLIAPGSRRTRYGFFSRATVSSHALRFLLARYGFFSAAAHEGARFSNRIELAAPSPGLKS